MSPYILMNFAFALFALWIVILGLALVVGTVCMLSVLAYKLWLDLPEFLGRSREKP
jgi:hypothetical protein